MMYISKLKLKHYCQFILKKQYGEECCYFISLLIVTMSVIAYNCFYLYITQFYECCILIVQRYPVVMSTYLGVMGRVLLQNTSFFSSLLNEMARTFNQEVRLNLLKLKEVRLGIIWWNNEFMKVLYYLNFILNFYYIVL